MIKKNLSRVNRGPGQTSRNMPSSQIRPPTSELLELHVFYVPEEVWNFKLNTISVDVTSKFFSAGFIRVSPHMTLRTLRQQLEEYLGEDAVVDKYSFLKCIGKKLAVVKAKQETELKLKSFAPPYAFHPELYLLPGVERTYSSSLSTPERHHNNEEYVLVYSSNQRPHSLAAPNNESGQNPGVRESSSKNHLSQTQEKGENSCDTEQRESITFPYILQDTSSAKQNSVKNSTSVKIPQRKPFSQTQERHNNTRMCEKYKETVAFPRVKKISVQEENNQIQVNHISHKTKEETTILLDANTEQGQNLKGSGMGRHTIGNSGIPESLEDRGIEYLHSKRSQQHSGITKSVADTGIMLDNQTDKNNLNDLAHPSQYLSPPTPPLLALSVNRAQVPNRVFPTEGSELNSQLQLAKAERKHLEKTREEIVKKVKVLLEQNKVRRYQARDVWKKKYFETKKITASLEDVCNKLQEDLELQHQKVLMQLEARDIRKRRNNVTQIANSKHEKTEEVSQCLHVLKRNWQVDAKNQEKKPYKQMNNTIIRITALQHEIDQLRRKLDSAKMKLVIEIKMRKQAASDLRALKAELAHKKVQTSLKFQSVKQVP